MIPIQNIYYMLSYAFHVLREQDYKNIETEPFDNVAELCAAILAKGVALQLKRGLWREYIEKAEPLSSPRGKIQVTDSIKTCSLLKTQLVCSYDNFSENVYMNRILKTTMMILWRADIAKARKKDLQKLLIFFGDVEVLHDLHSINWNMSFHRNNQTYRMLISVCYLVINGLLQTTADGATLIMDLLDEQRMCRLYEKFILEYYRKEFPQLSANASQIPWALDDGKGDMLPIMQSDITLSRGNRVLIIDAKYYAHTTQEQYHARTLHSGNLYQIFTYVKNKEAQPADIPRKVSGMLLYARTDEAVQPDNVYQMSGNTIYVRTLDLTGDFAALSAQLDAIAKEYFELDG